MFRPRLLALVVLALTLALPGIARAQDFPLSDVLRTDYFDNAHSWPDATVRITNPGTATVANDTVIGDLCAMIYVFRPDQEMTECCGCKVTPNGLLKLSVNDNLTNNPLHEGTVTSGVFKIMSALPDANGKCDPGAVVTPPVPTPALRAWATHIQDSGAVTETAFSGATLSSGEFASLVLNCSFIEGSLIPPGLGSRHGVCKCEEEKTVW
jgi:hypothetical protein